MKTKVLALLLIFAWCSAVPILIAQSTAPKEKAFRVLQLDELIESVHSDLLRLKSDHPWLSQYTTNCLSEGRSIFFMPRLTPLGKDRLLPQQPDQLYIGYIPIDRAKGFKYDNSVEDMAACRFPALGAKVYAHILVRDKGDAKTDDAIRQCIIKRCEALQKAISH